MANLVIRKGANNQGDNMDVPFFMKVIQNSVTILQCFSTQADPNNSNQCGITTQFDPALTTVIEYYNLGKLSNNVSFSGVNLVDGQSFVTGVNLADGRKESVSFGPISGSFSGNISVICNQISTTPSGVNYVTAGTPSGGAYPSIGSVNPSDNAWVSELTPNVVNNPWYVAGSGLVKPTVSATTLLNTSSLTVGGMQEGDIMHFFVNNVKQDNDDLVISVTGQLIFPNMTGYEGLVHFNYTRAGLTSPNSDDVTVSANPNLLGYLTLTSVSGQVGYYVGESVDVTGIDSGATLVIGKGSNASATTVGTDYTITTISGGFRVTFLLAQIYQFYQTKPTFIDGGKTAVTITGTRVALAKPIPSTLSRYVNETVTITNQATVGYSNINVYKSGLLISAQDGDYSVLGGVYTFLRIGSYTFVGQKTDSADSEPSNAVVVVVAPTLPSGNTRGRFHFNSEESIDLFASGNVAEANSTGAGYRWLKNSEDSELETVITYVDVLNSGGLSGIMAFENYGDDATVTASPELIGFLFKNDNSIGIVVRGATGLVPVTVKTLGSKVLPIKLKLEKVGTDFVFSYSTNVGVLNDTFTEFYRTPITLTDYSLSLVGSSGNTALQTTRFEQTLCSWGVIGETGSTN